MNGLDVPSTIAELTALHRRVRGMFLERRRQRAAGEPTRLQEFTLLTIRERGALQVSELVSLLDISPATASQLLSTMEDRGWLAREILATDRRRHRVALTEAGEETVLQMERRRQERFARLLAGLSTMEREQLVILARRVVEVLSEMPEVSREVL